MSKYRVTGIAIAILTLLLASVMGPTVVAGGSSKIADFKFGGNFKNSVGKSPVKMVVDEGAPSFLIVDVDGTMKEALVFPTGTGLKVKRIPRSARKVFSVEVFFEFDTVTSYRRIMSFGPNDVLDEALYVSDGALELYDVRVGTDTLAANEWVKVLVTRDAKRIVKVYLDGVQQFRYKDGKGLYTLKRGIMVLFKDESSEDSGGTVTFLRIHDRILVP